MKTLYSFLVLGILASAPASAHNTRLQRILDDRVTNAAQGAISEKYGVECPAVDPQKIHWRCLNGPQCGYTFVIHCESMPAKEKGVDIEVTGFDDGQFNSVRSLVFSPHR